MAELLPRDVARDNQGKLVFGPAIVDKTTGDELLMKNAVHGTIVTSKLYPLIWDDDDDHGGGDDNQGYFRIRSSLQYLRQLTIEQVDALTGEEVQFVGASLRDLVYANLHGGVAPVQDDEDEIIRTASFALGDSKEATFVIQGVPVTPWPTRTNRVLRLLSIEPSVDGDMALFEESFLRDKNNLVMAFCNPRDLSYHNFENIIPLDSMFADTTSPLQIDSVQDIQDVPKHEIIRFRLAPTNVLQPLKEWTSFTPPFNSDQRGGERLIFKSERLSALLTTAILAHTNMTFRFVNSVFRLNKFQPTDDKFQPHYDLPYYDSSQRQRSKYTVILYLTEGKGHPALQIGEHAIDGFEELEGVIFNQSLEHEGNPYTDGTKIFLRSELVDDIEDGDEEYDEEVARMFNIACYHSIFQEDLRAYATQLFNHSVASRFHVLAKPKYVLHYRFVNGVPYMTNGHDYWFLSSAGLKMAAILVIMDYFDAEYKLKRFRSMRKEAYPLNEDNWEDDKVFEWLQKKEAVAYRSVNNLHEVGFGCFDDLDSPLCQCCCPGGCLCPSQESSYNARAFNTLAAPVRETLNNFSVAIFDGSIRINMDDMDITAADIRFRTSGYRERVWFAACCGGFHHPNRNPAVAREKDVRLFHLPSIRYQENNGKGYHLTIDMFNNGWVDKELTIPVFQTQRGGVPVTTDDECLNKSSEYFPYPAVDDDHWETPIEAYRDIVPLLTKLRDDKKASSLLKGPIMMKTSDASSSAFRIYDPYYCDGAVTRNFSNLGFPDVYNKKEDCYRIWSMRGTPDFDVLVTNPPYGDIELLIRFLTSEAFGNRPWFLLLPAWVHRRDTFINGMAENNLQLFYLVPRERYVYWHPAKLPGSKKNDVFESMWICWGGTLARNEQLIDHFGNYHSNTCSLARSSQDLIGVLRNSSLLKRR